MPTGNMKYENRLILFMDILGFKEIVEHSINDEKIIEQVNRAIEQIRVLADSSEYQESQIITQFSDSIVVSYKVDAASSVFDLISSIGFIVINMVMKGYLVRGGVTVGKLYHTNDLLMGPAMNRAYEIESREAIYPRVVIDKSVLAAAGQNRAEFHSPYDEIESVSAYLSVDTDDKIFLEYVTWKKVVEVFGAEYEEYAPYLSQLAGLIESGLQHPSKRVREKFAWLYKLYRAEVTRLQELGQIPARRHRDPDFFDTMDAMPLYDELN